MIVENQNVSNAFAIDCGKFLLSMDGRAHVARIVALEQHEERQPGEA
jgi:hypothetical protein